MYLPRSHITISYPLILVETLVVSAGGNKEIQLPKNELTLSAFAVPADDKGKNC